MQLNGYAGGLAGGKAIGKQLVNIDGVTVDARVQGMGGVAVVSKGNFRGQGGGEGGGGPGDGFSGLEVRISGRRASGNRQADEE